MHAANDELSEALENVTRFYWDHRVAYFSPPPQSHGVLLSGHLRPFYAATLASAKGPELAGPRARTRITWAADTSASRGRNATLG
jgi:hypothetical protein